MSKLLEKQSKLSLKKVLIKLIQSLPGFIPADMLSELCAFVIANWKELKVKMIN